MGDWLIDYRRHPKRPPLPNPSKKVVLQTLEYEAFVQNGFLPKPRYRSGAFEALLQRNEREKIFQTGSSRVADPIAEEAETGYQRRFRNSSF